MGLGSALSVERTSGPARLGKRQCTHIKDDGSRCVLAPIPGGSVCMLHGGQTRHAQQAARRKLLALVEPAAETLMLAITRCQYERNEAGSVVCAVHGADGCPEWPVRVNAAKALLDRAGFGPQAKIEIDDKRDHSDLKGLATDALADELEQLVSELRANERASVVIDVEPSRFSHPDDTRESPSH